jgi:hypothetical protein
MINSLALFGIFAGWFYFPSAVIAPVTIGWGWLVSALFVIAFVECSAAITAIACVLAVLSRETTLVFAFVMFLALLLTGERSYGARASVTVLAVSCLLYLALRIGLTSGYAHQIDPGHVFGQLTSLRFPAHFFSQLLAQGMLALLVVLIAIRRPRYAAYLLAGATAVCVLAVAADVTDVGLLLGETLPFYAAIFLLAWGRALPLRNNDSSPVAPGEGHFGSSSGPVA